MDRYTIYLPANTRVAVGKQSLAVKGAFPKCRKPTHTAMGLPTGDRHFRKAFLIVMQTVTRPASILDKLNKLGYRFRLNECTRYIEINDTPITDGEMATIRLKLREHGITNRQLVDDVILSNADQNSYHPVREYFKSLKLKRGEPIAALASHVTDTDNVFGMWLRRWLIGSIAKVFLSEQNPMLVMDGNQGIGKSELSRWLCPLPSYFIESAINPEDKDCHLRLAACWLWEVAELGATVRKADREALKFFISRRTVQVRPPYGRADVILPAMASLIGTVNDEAGILNDPTGSRRFIICQVNKIDWDYREKIDASQVWAEAYVAFQAGEEWKLTPSEDRRATEINERYEQEDTVEGLLKRHYDIRSDRLTWWQSTITILEKIHGISGVTRQNSFALGACCRRLKLERARRKEHGQWVWGYCGLKLKTSKS